MFDLTKFAETQLSIAATEYAEKFAQFPVSDSRVMKIEPRIFFVKLPEGLATNVANYPETKETIGRFFNTPEGKDKLGLWISAMLSSRLVDAVVLIVEAFGLRLERGEKVPNSVIRSADPRRQEMVVAEIITREESRAIMQRFNAGAPDGPPIRTGFEAGDVSSSRFAPHLDARPPGATVQ